MKLKALLTITPKNKDQINLILFLVPIALSAIFFILSAFFYSITILSGTVILLIMITSIIRYLWIDSKQSMEKPIHEEVENYYESFLIKRTKKEAVALFCEIINDEKMELSEVNQILDKIHSIDDLEKLKNLIFNMQLYKLSVLLKKDE